MAEAHNAVIFAEGGLGAPVRQQLAKSDDFLTIKINKAFIVRLIRWFKRHLFSVRNELHNSAFPNSLTGWAIAVLVPPVLMTSTRVANAPLLQNMNRSLWAVGNQLPAVLGHRGRIAAVSAALGTSMFVGMVLLRRYTLRTLLGYRGWLYERPGHESRWTLLWGGAIQALSGRRPLLYSFQRSLPRLPVPTLKDTVDRFIESIEPVLPADQIDEVRGLAADFLQKEGPRLQRYLVLKSWLADNYVSDWWEAYVYLRCRGGLMINSNYYVSDLVKTPQTSQTSRAAALIHAALRFRQQLDRETLEPMVIRHTVPLCMEQYRRMFGTTRIPGKDMDTLVHYGRDSKHCVVMSNGMFFVLRLYTHLGHPLHAFEIEAQLERIKIESERLSPGHHESKIGALTAGNRTAWAKARQDFFSRGVNRQSMEMIDKALFMVILDDAAPDTLSEVGKQSLHGKGWNRWFDKSINLIFYANGKAGMNCEHSWADAPVIGHLWEYMLYLENVEGAYDSKGRCVVPLDTSMRDLKTPYPLVWSLHNEPAQKVIEETVSDAEKAIADLDLEVTQFEEFGKGAIKKCRVSPDGFVQQALQLAYFRNRGCIPLTYESCMTRLYQMGRTETVRSATNEGAEFVAAMNDPSSSRDERLTLFHKAVEKHQGLYRDAMSGKGVDRHLFALYVVSQGIGVESKFLQTALKEPWTLSTSQQPQQQTDLWDMALHKGYYVPGGGFGPVADDGYGVSYMVLEDCLFFHVSSKKSCRGTDSAKFTEDLVWALRTIKDLCLPPAPPQES